MNSADSSKVAQASPSPKADAEARLYRIRHSLAHVLAQAVMELRPGTKLGFGPPIDDGFYYDFILPTPITEAEFPALEKKMREFIKRGHAFKLEELPKAEALAQIDAMGEPYKREYAQELIEKQNLKSLTFYRTGPFVDMCEGPHVENTKDIPTDAFKLRSVAGAYWRGDSKNTMMTRIYAWAFATKAELDAHVEAFKLAQERDHKRLGKELDFFAVDEEIGKGLPLWLPHGTVIRDELEKFVKELEFKDGYQRVVTPHLAKTDLYFKTGHLPYYATHMYPFMDLKENDEVREQYVLKPMNCPHHHKIFAARPRSYRELPLRLAEYGQVYRFEDSGALSGLLRVRGMSMNDAHIYCGEEQIQNEFISVIEMHRKVYQTLGLNQFHISLSTWDPEDPKGKEKYVDNPQAWSWTEQKIREAVKETGFDFVETRGDGAFYGPKLDIQFKTVTGREETASTCQLDFAIAPRLGLTYKNKDNEWATPYIIHRAPAGTHERFVAFLIEHYGGAFPTWLSPVQIRFIPISDAFAGYCEKIVQELRGHFVRAELDAGNDSFNKRLRLAMTQKVPNVAIVGEKEMQSESVTLKRLGRTDQSVLKVAELTAWIRNQIDQRKND